MRTVFFVGVLFDVGKVVGRRTNRLTDIGVNGVQWTGAGGIRDRLNACLEAGVGFSVGQIEAKVHVRGIILSSL